MKAAGGPRGRAACLAVLLAAGLLAGSAPLAGGRTRIWLAPRNGKPRVGAIVTIKVKIRRARNVGSVPFTLLYDPARLEFLPASSREGGFLRKDGSSTSFLAVASSVPGGATGVIVGLSRLRSGRGARGKGTLCKLRFRARAPGISRLSFVRADLLDAGARPLAATFRGRTLRVRPRR